MSAQVDSMFSVRLKPWHDPQGKFVIDEYPGDWNEARKLAGLEWEPIEAPVYHQSGTELQEVPVFEPYGMSEDAEPLYKRTGTRFVESPIYDTNPDNKHVIRSDNGKILSVVSDGYTLINHAEMGEIVEAVLAQPNVQWETAGSLDEGRATWCLVSLDEPIELPGDTTVTCPFLGITNRHDGKGSCALRATAIRIVCFNTFRAAELEGERTGATYSFRHSKKWRDRIEDARQAVHGARQEMVQYKAMATELLGQPINAGQRELFVTTFIPAPPEGLVTERVMSNIEAARAQLRGLFDSPTTAGIQDTAYGLLQAGVEYLDHVRTARTWETKMNRTLIRPEPLKSKTLGLIREIVKAG